MDKLVQNSIIELRITLLVLLMSIAGLHVHAQNDGSSSALTRDIEAFLSARTDAEAEGFLVTIKLEAKDKEFQVLDVLKSRPKVIASGRLKVPYRGQVLSVDVKIPEGHTSSATPLPILFDISGGNSSSFLKLKGVIRVCIPGYTPPEFSDEGRDGFLKAARMAAWFGNGDLDRMWLTGFSWAAHASWDTALHRPGALRGIVTMGGGPRRIHFRLLANARELMLRSFCGGKDDAELIWNLKELTHIAKAEKLDYVFNLDPQKGHTMPLKGMENAASIIAETKAHTLPWWQNEKGKLAVDQVAVELPWLRVGKVATSRLAINRRVPVPNHLSFDARRRRVLKVYGKKSGYVSWKFQRQSKSQAGIGIIDLKSRWVNDCEVICRDGQFAAGQKLAIRIKGRLQKSVPKILAIEVETMLRDARRTGLRLRPALAVYRIEF